MIATPRSRIRLKTPCSAAWSASGPSRVVVPSASCHTTMSSTQSDQRWSRWPSTQITYCSLIESALREVHGGWTAWPTLRLVRVPLLDVTALQEEVGRSDEDDDPCHEDQSGEHLS